MNFALIVPEAHLELAALSNTHIVLSPYWKKSEKYRNFYRRMRARGDFILLDNGIHEYDYKRSDSWEDLIPIILDLKPNVAAIPESFEFDEDLLVKNIEEINSFRQVVPDSETEFLYVPRGPELADVQEELDILQELDELIIPGNNPSITWLGIHKGFEQLNRRNTGGRATLCFSLDEELAKFKLWMFGIYKSPVDEVESYKYFANVQGNDSSKPWRLAAEGRKISESKPYPKPFNFEQKIEDVELIRHVKKELENFVRTAQAT